MTKLANIQSLNDKVIIITGGSAGCGWGFSKACAEAGAKVVVADINPLSEERIEIIKALGHEPTYINTDVSDPESIQAMVDGVIDKFGVIDGVINNAGLTITGDFFDFDLATIDRLINTNLRSVFLVCQAASRYMRELGSGAIVNISSNHAVSSTPQYEMYAATKGGIVSMTRAMSWSLGKHGIRVNALCPGLTRTEPIHEMSVNDPELEKSFNAMHATGTFNSVEQLGAVGVFLLSDASASITGTEIIADQGMVASLCNAELITL